MSERFEIEQHDDGQIYVTEGGESRLHVQIQRDGEPEIQLMGDQRVLLDKLYGPLIFWPIRCTPDLETCEWIIEREFGGTGSHMEGNVQVEETEWREVARIPGQLDSDFSKPD